MRWVNDVPLALPYSPPNMYIVRDSPAPWTRAAWWPERALGEAAAVSTLYQARVAAAKMKVSL